jgi:hypothetical protein
MMKIDRNRRRRVARLKAKIETATERKSKKKLADECLAFFKQLLFKDRKRLDKYVHVTVKFKNNLGADGFCDVENDETEKYRDFTICIEKQLPRSTIVETVAHELVHVYQFATDKLRYTANGNYRWEGDFIDGETPYFSRPWEIEAYELEESLLSHWFHYIKKSEKK